MSENIIAPNVPNAVTIVIIVMIGAVILSFARKLILGRRGGIAGTVTTGPAFTGGG